VKERIDEALTPLGTKLWVEAGRLQSGETAYCDEALHVLAVRIDGTSEEWTIGARDASAQAELERRLGVPVVLRAVEGRSTPPPRAAATTAKSRPRRTCATRSRCSCGSAAARP
jgi:hypothetical protein